MNDNLMDMLHKANVEKDRLNRENIQLRNVLERAVNELCRKCGRKPDASIGACDLCPWHLTTKGTSV